MLLFRIALFTAMLLQAPAALAQTPPVEITIARGDEEYPPVEMHIDGKLTGYHIDLVEAAAESLGLKVNWVELPFARAQHALKTGKVDALTYLTPTEERAQWAIFLPGNGLSTPVLRFLIRKDDQSRLQFSGDQAAFLRDRTVLTIRGYYYSEEVGKAAKYETTSLESLIAMMMAKRYDVAVVNENAYRYGYANRSEFAEFILIDPPVRESKAYLAFSKAKPLETLAARFETAMNEFRKTRRHGTLRKTYHIGN